VSLVIRNMVIDDYDEVAALWQATEGVGLSDCDTREGVGQFLERNEGLSLVAFDGDVLAGVILCGHDGRRGYLSHLAVRESSRRKGTARSLVDQCLAALRRHAIDKCHIFVFASNQSAIAFWKDIGWDERFELIVLSRFTP
jgi:ribosomal protein S18 acetylase RimI-like enzyme